MRIAAMAAMLAVAHGTAFAANRDNKQDARDEAESQARQARSGTVDLYQGPPSAAAWRAALERAARDSGHYGCGCSPDRRGGHGGAAGF